MKDVKERDNLDSPLCECGHPKDEHVNTGSFVSFVAPQKKCFAGNCVCDEFKEQLHAGS